MRARKAAWREGAPGGPGRVAGLGAQAAARVQLRADAAPDPGAETGRRWAGSDGEEI